MTEDELLEYFKSRELNSKTNHMIIVGEKSNSLLDDIPNVTDISFVDDVIEENVAINIKIDLLDTSVKDILTYTLNNLKQLGFIDENIDCVLPFHDKFDLFKFRSILQNNHKVVQLFFYNFENLSVEEQMLFNELYYYNSLYFSIISFIKDHFKTYFLTQNRVLDNRENYQKYVIMKPYTLVKDCNN